MNDNEQIKSNFSIYYERTGSTWSKDTRSSKETLDTQRVGVQKDKVDGVRWLWSHVTLPSPCPLVLRKSLHYNSCRKTFRVFCNGSRFYFSTIEKSVFLTLTSLVDMFLCINLHN